MQTIYPALFRRVPRIRFERKRLTTSDGDFLDLDWFKDTSKHLVIITHGLEGSAQQNYVRGLVRTLLKNGFDCLAWHLRGCSGESNNTSGFYHSGATQDLREVIEHASIFYKSIALVGFSLGGNLTLKYLGEPNVHRMVKGAVTFSTPCHLASAAKMLADKKNRIYMQYFLLSLRAKLKQKAIRFPDKISLSLLNSVKSFVEFDEYFTAPLHGFQSASEYWEKSSSKLFIPQIKVPTLLVNAQNDPFLSPQCFPYDEAEENKNFWLECPTEGGHLGFVSFNQENMYWSEQRCLEFLREKIFS